MTTIHLNSQRVSGANPLVTTPISQNLYLNTRYNINPISIVKKKLLLKEISFNYSILPINESFNYRIGYRNVTDNIFGIYEFTPQAFNSITDMVTYLNTACPNLVFTYYNNVTDLHKYKKIDVKYADPTKKFQLILDSKSIFRLIGLYFGSTPVIDEGQAILGEYQATLNPLDVFYLSVGLPSQNLSNLEITYNFVATLDGIEQDVSNFGKKIRIYEFKTFSQYIPITSTQINQMIISFYDAFNNVVILNSPYTLTFELVD